MTDQQPLRLLVVGAGLVGERHAKLVADHPEFQLAGIVDPNPARDALAETLHCPRFGELSETSAIECDAAIVATPNADHLKTGLYCLGRGWPVLMEKPVASTMEEASQLVVQFKAAHLPLLVGHHRRYHPMFAHTKELLDNNTYGQPVAASIIWMVRKPDDYFDAGQWRKGQAGGPLLINFIHEADLLLGLFGPASSVTAITSNTQREGSAEDSAAILIRFESGLIATVIISDAALSPWSFEGATGENPYIAETETASWRIGCTNGSIEFPKVGVWQDLAGETGNWSRPLDFEAKEFDKINPLHEQLNHFGNLIRGDVDKPMVSGEDGMAALALVEAVLNSAKTEKPVQLSPKNNRQAAE